MNEKKRVTEKIGGRYRRVRKKEKGVILDEFTQPPNKMLSGSPDNILLPQTNT